MFLQFRVIKIRVDCGEIVIHCLVLGRGTVVVGTIKRGILKKGDEADLMGHDTDLRTTVSDIQVFKKSVASAQAGDNIGALLRGVRLAKVQRGMVLSAARSVSFANHFQAQIYFLTKAEGGRKTPVVSGYIQQIFCGRQSDYSLWIVHSTR